MSLDIALVFIVLLVTVILFALEVFPVDKVAMLIIVALALLGLVTPEEAISGFSNNATIAVLALMMLAVAMEQNGVIGWLALALRRIKSLPLFIMTPIIIVVTASISAFISTTAVVIVLTKVINQLSMTYRIPQAKLLLPISFAGILGGSCTLMGTSTNLIVNSVASDLGADRLLFFEFTHLGLIFLGISVVYLTATQRWLPWGSPTNLRDDYGLDDFITSVHIHAKSSLVGKRIEETFLFGNPQISLLKLTRDQVDHHNPGKYITLKANDQLLLKCNLVNLSRLKESGDLSIITEDLPTELDQRKRVEEKGEGPAKNQGLRSATLGNSVFVELLMLPGASLLGKTLGDLKDVMFQQTTPLAIKKRDNIGNWKRHLRRSKKDDIILRPGDRLLLEVEEQQIPSLGTMDNVILLQQIEKPLGASETRKYFSLFVLILVVFLAAVGLLSIMVSALMGVCLLLITNNLSLEIVYKKVNWQIFFLLAGMIPLGIAMHNSGADALISAKLLMALDGQSNTVVIGSLFLGTMALSGIVSNNATAIIMTPIAVAIAVGLELDIKPFILVVMFASNFSFFTPLGYQTNTLVYSMGKYKFRHFFLVGGLLSVILWFVATVVFSNMLP